MSFLDVIVIVVILVGGVAGYKKGVVRALVSAVGFFLITVLSFLLKNPLSIIFYENLPFFKFGGIFKGVTVLNIALYEFLAFLVVFLILMLLWKVVILASNILQKIINMTIILGFPSKLLGFVVGCAHYYIICFVVLYLLMTPLFSIKEVVDSKVSNFILNETPFISAFVSKNGGFISEFISLKDKYNDTSSANEFNYETLDLFLKYDVISIDSAKKLYEKDKLKIDGIEELIKKYDR